MARQDLELPDPEALASSQSLVRGMLKELKGQGEALVRDLLSMGRNSSDEKVRLQAIKTAIELLLDLVDREILTKQAKKLSKELTLTLKEERTDFSSIPEAERERLIRLNSFKDVSRPNRTERTDRLRVETGESPVDVPSTWAAEDPGLHREPEAPGG